MNHAKNMGQISSKVTKQISDYTVIFGDEIAIKQN